MVSFVVGLEGVTQVTVDVFALGMAETDEQLYRKTTTLMTNDPEVADAFRPYRFKRTHERVNLLVEAEAHEVLRNTLNSSNCNEGVSPPSRSSDPSQPMTLAVRGDDEPLAEGRDEDSALEDDESTDDQQPTRAQIKMIDQYHRHLGHPPRRKVLKVLKAAHSKLAVLEHVRCEKRCAD